MNSRAATLQLISTLLYYPDEDLTDARGELLDTTTLLPPSPAREKLMRFLDWYHGADPIELARHYVATFDLRRKSSLYLTYYLHGDTRKRGMALLMLKQRYRAAGLVPPDDELPDFLPMICEFAAIAGPDRGESPLRQHRAGIELIRSALRDADSPYTDVIEALCSLLPHLSPAERARIVETAADGPPEELVGLAPFAPPEYVSGREVRA